MENVSFRKLKCAEISSWEARTHIVLSEFIDGDLCLHQVIVENNDFPAERSLFLLMVLRLQTDEAQQRRSWRQKQKKTGMSQ